eukprot:TRINITY_DN6660_c0_g1_i1.p2 TRINITY_DN6660_c0_g1~~TRINITY_DN6660_c0_g1_i1.p2  ORF type:complete len:464 (-),score=68.06 TRINITY_DN6660_c0_g1_i1:1623-3014(-)
MNTPPNQKEDSFGRGVTRSQKATIQAFDKLYSMFPSFIDVFPDEEAFFKFRILVRHCNPCRSRDSLKIHYDQGKIHIDSPTMPYTPMKKEALTPFLTPMSHRGSTESNLLLINNHKSTFNHPQVQQFLTIDQVQLIAQKLHLPQARISALQSLAPEEALYNAVEHWGLLKSGLRSCLLNPKTSAISLQIHLRLMKYDTLSTKEAYISMTEALVEIYASSSIQEQGIKIIKALLEYNRILPSNWIRFPESHLHEMISSFMNLLGILPKSDKCVPLQIICMVDPGSAWLREWFQSDFGRSLIVKCFPLNALIYFSQESTGILKNYSQNTWDSLSKTKYGVLSEPLLSYSVFLTSYTFITQCLKYKRTRQRLIHELGPGTPLQIFTEMIEFLLQSTGFGPMKYIVKSLGDLIMFNSSWILQEYLLETRLLSKIINSLNSPQDMSSKCMILKAIYTTQHPCLLNEKK